MKKTAVFLLFCLVFATTQARAQGIPSYYVRSQFLMTPPATFQDGLVGFSNPANLALIEQSELRFYWSTDEGDLVSLENWGAFAGRRHFGFSAQRQKFDGVGVTDFKLSGALGSRTLAFGAGYGWSAGEQDAQGREKLFSLGTIARPNSYISLGFTGNLSVQSQAREGVAEIGIRPTGTARITLFADAAFRKGVAFSDTPWSFGGAFKTSEGTTIVGRYFDSQAFTLGLSLNLGYRGLGAQVHFDQNADHAFNTFYVRSGAYKRNKILSALRKEKYYVPLHLKGRVDYLSYKYLDSGSIRLFDILDNIRKAKEDPGVSTLALNLSGLSVRAEHAWEVREELKKAKLAGKQIVVFLDRGGMSTYHLASIADRVIMDPEGSLMLEGYAINQSYLKGTLAKLGIGFDEWRFFKYKSTNEIFSRDSMSAADSEQRQAFVDDWYESTRSDICASRNFDANTFDGLIDSTVFFMSDSATQAGLADTTARWTEIEGIVKEMAGARRRALSPSQLQPQTASHDTWGDKHKIAVVYGLGVCAMDEGIKARWLEQLFLALSRRSSVKAVVFRVDSPGGDGLASDVVAQAIRTCRMQKPVIVSQGQVAASGGYWISAYGDRILAGPSTVTGSIGVAFGWLYDDGFSEKSGMTSDLVKRGAHADLGRGIGIPFTPWQIPARNLSTGERQKAENIMRTLYSHFVRHVATGRGLSEERVRELGEGRIYSGLAGKETRLVDEIGGLADAVAVAKTASGLTPTDEVEIIEFPRNRGLIDLSRQISPLGLQLQEDVTAQFLKLVSEKKGIPLPLLLPGTYPDFETY